MKGYLFGLGAMLVGAGLMFVLMHGEVSADISKDISNADENSICEYMKVKMIKNSTDNKKVSTRMF